MLRGHVEHINMEHVSLWHVTMEGWDRARSAGGHVACDAPEGIWHVLL